MSVSSVVASLNSDQPTTQGVHPPFSASGDPDRDHDGDQVSHAADRSGKGDLIAAALNQTLARIGIYTLSSAASLKGYSSATNARWVNNHFPNDLTAENI